MKKILSVFVLIITIHINAQEINFGKVSKEELQEKFHPLDSTADAAYLNLIRKTYYTFSEKRGFEIVTEIHERIKIYTKEGFENATRSIIYYKPDSGSKDKVNSIKGYTFTFENGNIEKQKLSKSSIFDEKLSKYKSLKKITFPNIKEGVIIDLEYKITSPYTHVIDEIDYQFGIPVKYFYSSIEIPEYYTFAKKQKGYFLIPVKTSTRNTSITTYQKRGNSNNFRLSVGSTKTNFQNTVDVYEAENIPALRDTEPYISNIKNFRGGIKYELASTKFPNSKMKFYSSSWEDVSKQIYKSSNFGSELEKTGYFENDIEPLISSTTNNYEKVASIFQFVKEKVKWNNYYGKYVEKGVKSAYKDGTGNIAEINLMLTSMLRYAGLNAYPVLVSTRANGTPLFPTLNGFNYVITMVKFPDNKYILLDASEPYSLPNILPKRALNWNGRVVAENGGSSWVKLAPSKHATVDNLLMAKVTEDMTIEGFIRTKFFNHKALTFRKDNNHIEEETLITNFEEKNSIEIENFKISNIQDLGTPVNRDIKFSSEDLIEKINDKIYIEPLLFLTERENPFKIKDRKFPVDFASPLKYKNSISIQIPTSYKIESLPETLAIGLPEKLGLFKYQISQVGNKIKVLSVLQFNKSIIAPEHYLALKDFYSQLVKKQTEKIVLVKKQ
ncbi:transglutaminase domain-containing protein [Tenacibaculum sp. FZY0031]|uniref:transglutaminase domain-containing protein n=1 Tax=Tenacibaculum sp. FZY0031 TaxID=3116648 RepID=UPI002ECF24AF|nr:transglutaminase domain-containing protein [Tenacibaculum sp. FZY0031]